MAVNTRRQRHLFQAALVVYALVWLIGLGIGTGRAWWLSGATAAAYVAMHWFALRCRDRCWLSADATALPVSLGVIVLLTIGASLLAVPATPISAALPAYGCVWMSGHIAVMAFVLAAQAVGDRLRRP